MNSFDVSAYLGSSSSLGNALGLAVHPQSGNIFLTTGSYAGEPNLYQFKSNGVFVQKNRIAIDLLTVPGNPGSVSSAVIGKNDHLFICVAKPVDQSSFAFSVAEVSLDGGTVYSSFPCFVYTLGGAGITYNASRQSLLLSSFSDKVIYEVNLNGVLMDRFDILISASDIVYAPASGSVFVLSENYMQGAIIEYKKDAGGKYSRVNTYSLKPLSLAHPLALGINSNTGLLYIQDNNVRVVEFSISELELIHVPAISGSIAVTGIPAASCRVTLSQALQADQMTSTDGQGNFSFDTAVEKNPFKIVIESE